MRLNICVDIDGTITDPYDWLKYINKHFKTNISAKELVKFDVCRVLDISEEDYEKFYDIYGEHMHLNAVLREDVKDKLNKLYEHHNIYYVTARPKEYEEVTKKWIHNNGLPKGKLFMMGSHNKVEKAKEVGCDIFIEDRYRNAVHIAKAGINVLMLDCNYNQYPLIDGITRVTGWNEIYSIIEEYKEGIA